MAGITGQYYPRDLFSINEAATRRNIEAYDRKYDAWYMKAEEMFPDYYRVGIKERTKMRDAVNEVMGYSL